MRSPGSSAWGVVLALAGVLGMSAPCSANPRASVGVDPDLREVRLAANRIALFVANNGGLGWTQARGSGGLEYPRDSAHHLLFASGLWVGGRVAGVPRNAIAEFRMDFTPGVISNGTWGRDTARFRAFHASRLDTTGWAAWVHVAGPLGAPLDPSGTRPEFPGEAAVWTVFHDADPTPTNGSGRSLPIGVEVQQLVYAFHRPGALDRAVFLRHTLIHKGATTIDSAYVGLFQDYVAGDTWRVLAAASEPTRDLAYAYRFDDEDGVYGPAAPAIGFRILRGPWDDTRTHRLGMNSNVIWANGTDPSSPLERDRVLRGLRRDGTAILDSSTLAPTSYWASGDPVTGTGWNPRWPTHPHGVMAAGPFTFAPGDTQSFEAVIVVGHADTRLASITAMRLASDTLLALRDADFATAPDYVPDPDPPPPPPAPPSLTGGVRVHPNPAIATAHIRFTAHAPGERVRIEILDATGRLVRRLLDSPQPAGDGVIDWDGCDHAGARTAPGLYVVRVRSAAGVAVARFARFD